MQDKDEEDRVNRLAKGRFQLLTRLNKYVFSGYEKECQVLDKHEGDFKTMQVMKLECVGDHDLLKEMADGPHIEKLLGYFQDDRYGYFLQRLYYQFSLSDWLSALPRPMGMAMAKRMVLSLGAALAYAHEKGIAHTAIDPESIAIDQIGRFKFKLFQQAAWLKGASVAPRNNSIYTAPEHQQRWLSGEDLCDADLYSLVVVTIEALGGHNNWIKSIMPALTHYHSIRHLGNNDWTLEALQSTCSPAIIKVLADGCLLKIKKQQRPNVSVWVDLFGAAVNESNRRQHGQNASGYGQSAPLIEEKASIGNQCNVNNSYVRNSDGQYNANGGKNDNPMPFYSEECGQKAIDEVVKEMDSLKIAQIGTDEKRDDESNGYIVDKPLTDFDDEMKLAEQPPTKGQDVHIKSKRASIHDKLYEELYVNEW